MIEPVVTYLEQGDNEAQIRDLGKLKHLRPRLWAREFASQGEPRGTMAILHDHGEHGGRYSRLGGRFAELGWAVTVFDFRGHGDSDGERNGEFHAPEDLLDDVDLALFHVAFLLPEAPRVVVGTGLGGLVAIAFAMRRSDRCAAFVALNPDLRAGAGVKKAGLLGGLLGGGTLGIDPSDRFRDPAKAQAFAQDKKVTLRRTGKTAAAVDSLRALVRDGAASLARPGVLVVSRGDRVSDPEASRAFVRAAGANATLVECDLGHAIVDDPDAEKGLAPALEFLDRRFPRGVGKIPNL
ncbi:MAG TPA: alpha/beta fold hydrolase [Planctomycetota bacterium]|nr:alpha/beta fold hydrolase [Planctomycetota bacterium]